MWLELGIRLCTVEHAMPMNVVQSISMTDQKYLTLVKSKLWTKIKCNTIIGNHHQGEMLDKKAACWVWCCFLCKTFNDNIMITGISHTL